MLKKLKGIFTGYANEQVKLILVASLPCFVVALFSLWFNGVSVYLISFFAIVFILLIMFAIVASKQKANFQIQTLVNMLESMIEGDYSIRGRKQNNPAFQQLFQLVNTLSNNLAHHKLNAQESQRLLDKVINQTDAVIIATNEDNECVLLNDAAKTLFLLNDNETQTALPNLEALDLLSLNLVEESGVIQLSTQYLEGEFFLLKDAFINKNQHHTLFLLTRADRLLREKERQAWQGLVRVLSHEMNNSLAPIASFSRTLLKRLDKETTFSQKDQFHQGLSIINQRAASLSQFIDSYTQLSHLPPANKSLINWQLIIDNLSKMHCGTAQVINHINDLEAALPTDIYFDRQQFEQVMINIFKNAHEAMAHLPPEDQFIHLKANVDGNWLLIEIIDNGTSIINKENLFIPFYTTKENGSGIGLSLCQQIMFNHNGKVSLKNNPTSDGAIATLAIPVSSASNALSESNLPSQKELQSSTTN